MNSLAISLVNLCVLAATPPAPIDVEFTAAYDHTLQRYVVVVPAEFDAEQPHDVLIALHGHGADRWQFVKDERDECRSARDAAASHDMIFVSPDYRAKTSWMGPAAEADLLQIIDEVKKHYVVGRVFLCGGSMGATSALIFASRHPELLAGVVAKNGTANMVEYGGFQDAIAESYGGTKAEVPEVYKERSAELSPDRFTMPVAFTTGGADTIVPPDSVLRLAEKLKALGRDVLLIHRPEGPHSTTYEDGMHAFAFMMEKAK